MVTIDDGGGRRREGGPGGGGILRIQGGAAVLADHFGRGEIGAADDAGGAAAGIERAAAGRAVQVVVAEAGVVADDADQRRAGGRAVEAERNGFFQAVVEEGPGAGGAGGGEVGGLEESEAGVEERAAGVVGIDVDVGHPVRPGIGPGRIAERPGRGAEGGGPGAAAVGGAIDFVARPPAQQGADDHVAGHARVGADAAEEALAGRRKDGGPGAAISRHFPNAVAGGVTAGAGGVAPGRVEDPGGVEGPLQRRHFRAGGFARVVRHLGPGVAVVVGKPETLAGHGVGGGVEAAVRARTGSGGRGVEQEIQVGQGGGEIRQAGPGRAVVAAAPDAEVVGADEQVRAVERIDDHPLAGAAAFAVAGHFETGRGVGPGRAAVGRTVDAGIQLPGLGAGVLAGGDVNAIRVVGIEGDGLDAEVLELIVEAPDVVVEGDPAVGGRVEAIGAADVGAGVDQAGLGRMEDGAGDEAAATDFRRSPVVGLGGGGTGQQQQPGEQGRKKARDHGFERGRSAGFRTSKTDERVERPNFLDPKEFPSASRAPLQPGFRKSRSFPPYGGCPASSGGRGTGREVAPIRNHGTKSRPRGGRSKRNRATQGPRFPFVVLGINPSGGRAAKRKLGGSGPGACDGPQA